MEKPKPFLRRWWVKLGLVLLAIPTALFTVAIAVNCRDETLSEQTLKVFDFGSAQIPDEKNLYLAVLGIDGPLGSLIHESGRRFLTSHERQARTFLADPAHQAPPDFEPEGHIEAEGKFEWCNNGRAGIWKTSSAELDGLLRAPVNVELLKRYDSLKGYPIYQDASTPGLDEPAPFIRSNARCLFMAREVLGLRGSAESIAKAVTEVLADMDTWRRMLQESESSLGKLIAAANLRSDLTLLVEAETENPSATKEISRSVEANPPWTLPSDWDVSNALTRSALAHVQLLKQVSREAPAKESGHLAERLINRFEMHFYQPNATANLICSSELLIAGAGKVPLSQLRVQLSSALNRIGNETVTLAPRVLYNPMGRVLAGISSGVDGNLPLQLADSRVFEQLARLVIEAHSKGFSGANLPSFMASHPELSTNPLLGEPFVYDGNTQTVSFQPAYKREYPMRSSLPA